MFKKGDSLKLMPYCKIQTTLGRTQNYPFCKLNKREK